MRKADHSCNHVQNSAVNYQEFFVPSIGYPIAMDLLDVAELQTGEDVLDVACGTGVVSRLAAEAVGDTGHVTGLDLNAGMLEVARSATPSDRAIEWIEADAENMPLADNSFNAVLCQMGLQFMPGKLAALREMHRTLSSPGRICINVPGPMPEMLAVMADAIRRHFSQQEAAFIEVVFSLHDKDELRELFCEAGFSDIDITAKQKSLVVPSPREFLWQYLYSTPLAGTMAAASRQTQCRIDQEVCSEWEKFAVDHHTGLEVQLTTVSATR